MWPHMQNNEVFVVKEFGLGAPPDVSGCTGGNPHKCHTGGHHSLFSLSFCRSRYASRITTGPPPRVTLTRQPLSQLLQFFFPDCVENIIQPPAEQNSNTAEPTQLLRLLYLLVVVNPDTQWMAVIDKKKYVFAWLISSWWITKWVCQLQKKNKQQWFYCFTISVFLSK